MKDNCNLNNIGYDNIDVAMVFLSFITSEAFILYHEETNCLDGFIRETTKNMASYISGFKCEEEDKEKHKKNIFEIIDIKLKRRG